PLNLRYLDTALDAGPLAQRRGHVGHRQAQGVCGGAFRFRRRGGHGIGRGRHFANLDLEGVRLALAPDFDFAAVAGLGGADDAGQIGPVLDFLVVELGDDVAGTHAGLGRGPAGFDAADHGAARIAQADRLGHIRGNLPDLHAYAAAGNLAVIFELLDHAHDLVDGNGQRNAHEAAALGDDLRIDAHHLSGQVDERTTRV